GVPRPRARRRCRDLARRPLRRRRRGRLLRGAQPGRGRVAPPAAAGPRLRDRRVDSGGQGRGGDAPSPLTGRALARRDVVAKRQGSGREGARTAGGSALRFGRGGARPRRGARVRTRARPRSRDRLALPARGPLRPPPANTMSKLGEKLSVIALAAIVV